MTSNTGAKLAFKSWATPLKMKMVPNWKVLDAKVNDVFQCKKHRENVLNQKYFGMEKLDTAISDRISGLRSTRPKS